MIASSVRSSLRERLARINFLVLASVTVAFFLLILASAPWIHPGIDLSRLSGLMFGYLVLVVAGIAAVLGLVLRWQARQIDKLIAPLHELSRQMARLPGGAVDMRLAETGIVELDGLEAGCKSLLQQLDASRRNLAMHLGCQEQVLEERTRDLRQAKDAAEARSKAKSEFLATMSHEIRTPMSAVLGITELLLNTRLEPTQRQFVEAVERSGRHLLGIINDILDFSKIESGKLELEKVDFDLPALLEESLELFSQPAQKKGLELVADLPLLDSLRLRGDPLRLRQVVANLLSNAVKFTERGEIVVTLEVLESSAGVVKFDLGVRDTGIGIPDAARERIFEHFLQADGATARAYGGSGLGLAICRRLVEMMGGKLSLESRPGEGSTFRIELSLPQASPRRSGEGGNAARRAGIRLLIVDDNRSNREILLARMLASGFAAEAAASGEEALHRLGEAAEAGRPFAVVLLDLPMPGFPGTHLASRIRGDQRLPATRIVLLCPSVDLVSPEDRLRLDISACLVKPARQVELVAAVEAGFRRRVIGDGKPAGMPAPRVRGHVLLAEDNESNMMIARAHLERAGLRVSCADDGQRAVEMMAAGGFDLVLMDCQMPVIDGFAATRLLRQREAASGLHLPVVALTANALPGDRLRCLAAGMDDYLAKPYRGEDMAAILQRWLPAERRQAENRRQAEEHVCVATSGAALDPAVLDRIRALSSDSADELVGQLAAAYLKAAKRDMARLEQAWQAADAELVACAAHGLKSSSFNVGANRFGELLRDMEAFGRAGDLAGVARGIEVLHAEWERVRSAVNELLGEATA